MDAQQLRHGDVTGEEEQQVTTTQTECVQAPAAPQIQPEEATESGVLFQEDDLEHRTPVFGYMDDTEDDALEVHIGLPFYRLADETEEDDLEDRTPFFGYLEPPEAPIQCAYCEEVGETGCGNAFYLNEDLQEERMPRQMWKEARIDELIPGREVKS